MSKLKIGKSVDSFFYTILFPITFPTNKVRTTLDNDIVYIKNLPGIEKQNRDQKLQIATLVTENEFLKQNITDKETIKNLSTFKEVIPVRFSGTQKYSVTSTYPSDKVITGQPLVSGSVLLGVVSDINNSIISITPLDDRKISSFSIRTTSNIKGKYKFDGEKSLLTDIPSQNQINLGDFVLTEASDQIPANLLIGKISSILTGPEEPLQKVSISLYDHLSDVSENLAIIIKP